MAEQTSATNDALHVKVGEKVDIAASEKVVQELVHGWEYTLYWYGNHPVQGDTIFGFVLAIALIWARSRREVAQMNQEYQEKLKSSEQPQLPLPPPQTK